MPQNNIVSNTRAPALVIAQFVAGGANLRLQVEGRFGNLRVNQVFVGQNNNLDYGQRELLRRFKEAVEAFHTVYQREPNRGELHDVLERLADGWRR